MSYKIQPISSTMCWYKVYMLACSKPHTVTHHSVIQLLPQPFSQFICFLCMPVICFLCMPVICFPCMPVICFPCAPVWWLVSPSWQRPPPARREGGRRGTSVAASASPAAPGQSTCNTHKGNVTTSLSQRRLKILLTLCLRAHNWV